MSALTLRSIAALEAQTVGDICLPEDVWNQIDAAAQKARLSRGDAIAQIIMDRIKPTAPAATRRAKK